MFKHFPFTVAYIIGGYDGTDDIYDDIRRLDLEKMKWTKILDLDMQLTVIVLSK